MTRLKYVVIPLLLILLVSTVHARGSEIILQKASNDRYVPAIPIYVINQYQYISISALLNSYKTSAFLNPTVKKSVFRLDNLKIKVTAYNRYIMVEDKTFQMSKPVIFFDGETYLPMKDFVDLLQKVGLVSTFTILTGDDTEELMEKRVEELPLLSPYDIVSSSIEERQNGTVIRIRTANRYDAGSVKSWINRGEWLYVTLPSAKIDKATLEQTQLPTGGSVRSVSADQLDGTAQLAFRLRGPVEGHDLLHRDNPPEILITVRKPYVIDQSHFLDKERAKWTLDKIVLDAGHGGHDPGARGNGAKEKDITLDVVKRLGKLIEQRTDIEVVYTRKKDVFVPLWERTKFANEEAGKLFLSIHVNANKNKRASGFETYFLRPGKIDASVAVVELENSAIKYEENTERYEELTNSQHILASMYQSTTMRESEVLADLLQSEFDKKLVGQNRGVKQAGFIVLIGATMPNVLIELGFISNKNDARRLKQSAYRQKAAESIFNALMKYKTRHEKLLSP